MPVNQMKAKSEYGSRGLIELVYSDPTKRTYTGNINAIVLGDACNFPNDNTSCLTELGGVNLSNYTNNYPSHSRINCQFSKVTITAGRCFLEVQ